MEKVVTYDDLVEKQYAFTPERTQPFHETIEDNYFQKGMLDDDTVTVNIVNVPIRANKEQVRNQYLEYIEAQKGLRIEKSIRRRRRCENNKAVRRAAAFAAGVAGVRIKPKIPKRRYKC